MHLLLVSATKFEVIDLVSAAENHSLNHNRTNLKWLISGIGQLQTTWAIQKSIEIQRPDLIIQCGIGGASQENEIGEVFAIRSDKLADLGLMENQGFSDIYQIGLSDPEEFPFTGGKLVNPYVNLLQWSGLRQLDGETVNEIKSADLPGFKRNPSLVVESMEGAALHYVGLMEKIPFLQLRAISNLTGDRDKNRWKIKEAIKALHDTLVLLIQKLEKADETLFRI